jgi:hypothetical protein
MTRKAVAIIIGAYLLFMAGIGVARSANPARWEHYRSRQSGNVLVVKAGCLAGEDSAAHLRLVGYRDHGAYVALGCSRKGF